MRFTVESTCNSKRCFIDLVRIPTTCKYSYPVLTLLFDLDELQRVRIKVTSEYRSAATLAESEMAVMFL